MSNKTSIEGLSALLHTLMLIPQHRWITVRELQQQLAKLDIHRTTRSIKRYLDEVIVDLFNVECDTQSMPHIYRKTSEQLLRFNKQETLHWYLTSKYLRPVIPEEVSLSLGSLPESHEALWNKGLPLSKERLWLNKVHVELPDISHWGKAQQEVLQAVHTALFHNRLLRLSSQVMQQEELSIEPLGILARNDSLLLLFRQSKDHPIQTIAIPLIDKASVSTFSFSYPPDFNLEQFVREHEGTEYPEFHAPMRRANP
ncbi:WYL domain-containing protein [Vibrio harveyi]|uniref:WYL domain-containing protein n=1 Tax=Vibrio harveyi TaxID=669 RepID=UPI003AAB2C5D